MSTKSFTGKLAKCASLALVFGIVGGIAFQGTNYFMEGHLSGRDISDTETQIESTSIQPTKTYGKTETTDISQVVDGVMPSIVAITSLTQQEVLSFFGGRTIESESSGSGIIISRDQDKLYIATNNHVVEKAKTLTVQFSDDSTAEATVRGTAPSNDLAVVSVNLSDLSEDTLKTIKEAVIGDSTKLSAGQAAIAIGNALGYGQSVTTGVVSALNREVTVEDERGGAITNSLLQTSAAINPGNSGGPLVNMKGEVIGINSVKYNDTQVEGMGFAIPISTAEPIINDLITREIVDESNSSHLGVNGQDVTEGMSNSFGIPEGLYITYVEENSAAEQAGIRKGDVMTEFDGRKVRSRDGLEEILRYYAAGTEVTIKIQANRNGEWQEQELTAVLGKKNE